MKVIYLFLSFLAIIIMGVASAQLSILNEDNSQMEVINLVSPTPFTNATYGEMWNYSSNGWTFAIAATGVYYNLTNLTAGDLNGFTFTDELQENGGSYLTAEETGMYVMTSAFSFAALGPSAEFGIVIAKNFDVDLSRDCYSRRTISASGARGSVVNTCIMELDEDDTINLQVEDEDNPTTSISVLTANVNIRKLEISEIVQEINTTFGVFDNANIAYINNSQNFSQHNSFGNISMKSGNFVNEIIFNYEGTFGESKLQNAFTVSDAILTLPKATTVINGQSVADTNSVSDSDTATAVSRSIAECFEHIGDRDNQICFGSDEQKFQVATSKIVYEINNDGAKAKFEGNPPGSSAGADLEWYDTDGLSFVNFDASTSKVGIGIGTSLPIVQLDVNGSYMFSNQYFYAYDNAGAQTLGSAWVSIDFDTVIRQDDIFTSFNNQNLTVNIGSGGEDEFDYKITFDGSTDVSVGSARSTSVFRLIRNGAEIDGSRCWIYNRISSQGEGSCSVTLVDSLADGDVIGVQGMRNAGTDTIVTIADGIRLNVQLI